MASLVEDDVRSNLGSAVFSAANQATSEKPRGSHMDFVLRHKTTLLIATCMFLVGLFLSSYNFGHVIHMTGDVLMVAAFTVAVVDLSFKESIIRDVAKFVFTWNMPQKARDRIQEMMEPNLTKENYTVFVILTIESGNVHMKVRERYEIYNYTSKSREYRPKLQIDNHENPIKESISLSLEIDGKPEHFGTDKVRDKIKVDEGITSYTHTKTYVLRPVDMYDRSKVPYCVVNWSYELVLPMRYSPLISTKVTTIGCSVKVEWPKDRLVFGCECNDSTIHAPDSETWRFDRAYFDGQYIRMWWWPKEDKHEAEA